MKDFLPAPQHPADILREQCARRRGAYADAYRLGLSVAAREIEPALDAKALGQGYRDGLALRPYRIPKKGKGAVSRNKLHVRNFRARKKAVQS